MLPEGMECLIIYTLKSIATHATYVVNFRLAIHRPIGWLKVVSQSYPIGRPFYSKGFPELLA